MSCSSHLARNFLRIFHIYSSSVSYWYITYFPVCNLIYYYAASYFCLVRFLSEYKLSSNPIWIYVPPFITSMKASFYFLAWFFDLRIKLACFINVLYDFCVACMFVRIRIKFYGYLCNIYWTLGSIDSHLGVFIVNVYQIFLR